MRVPEDDCARLAWRLDGRVLLVDGVGLAGLSVCGGGLGGGRLWLLLGLAHGLLDRESPNCKKTFSIGAFAV